MDSSSRLARSVMSEEKPRSSPALSDLRGVEFQDTLSPGLYINY